MHPKNLSIQEFSYLLPEEKIANYPLAERDASKLLIYKEGVIKESLYKNIAADIPADALLVFNNTKVVAARLLFQKPSGGIIEIFCLEPYEQFADIHAAMQQQQKVVWQCLVGGASKWKPGQVLEKLITIDHKEIKLQAAYIEKRTGSFLIELSWTPPDISFAEVLHHAGAIPLPPYIKRKAEPSDTERYQTIYANYDGSVAAPTAGLHFTDAIFTSLQKKNIQHAFVTLHVGAGTFKPVKADIMNEHEMHGEMIDVSYAAIEQLIANLDKTIIPVGTTSMRTIESLYWIGVKIAMHPNNLLTDLTQWEAYDIPEQNIPAATALQTLLDWMKKNNTDRLFAKTQILIAPGYTLKIARGLITNFHQPQSTLLLLIAAIVGSNWKKIYDYALQHDYRFLSYGDGCLLFPE